MKVKNNEIMNDCRSKEREFRKIIGNMLKKHFKLEWEDLPIILRKLGIKEEEYELTDFYKYDQGRINFYAVTKGERTLIEFMAGDMINPYPKVRVTKENAEPENYYVSKDIVVQSEKELLSLGNFDKEKARRLYEELINN